MNRFQRIVQSATLMVFLLLLVCAGFPLPGYLPLDGFLRMDPLAGAAASLSARHLIVAFWPALLVVVFTVVLGRFFCGYLCPMGTTIDLVESAGARRGRPLNAPDTWRRWRPVKFHALAFLLGTAALGVSFVFLASPLALITRFYGNLVMPVVAAAADGLLGLAADWPEPLRVDGLAMLQVPVHRFAHQWFLVVFFVAVFAASRLAPRFWCRYLCPAGAVLALCSHRPMVRRRVSDACVDCGQCQRQCPMGAIDDNDPRQTAHGACITCQQCVAVCPVTAVGFAPGGRGPVVIDGVWADRRRLLGTGIAGAATALVSLSGLHHLHGREGLGRILPPELIRPPGSLPEDAFLASCLRCGECLSACPTNTLQPLGTAIGITGLFSPVLTPRRGPCEPGCNVCGWVCPTGAIRSLPLREKTWAKVGTAHILRHKCLAWEFDRRCLVCDEVCPYDAVELTSVAGIAVGVPVVHENRCAGCGLCEHHCPVKAQAAIVVEPMGELRLAGGSYEEKARSLGLSLVLAKNRTAAGDSGERSVSVPHADYPAAPGETAAPDAGDRLPPGFTR
ncbi:MAG: 4Fe-4S binding protein [Pseudomonadota bacterium]